MAVQQGAPNMYDNPRAWIARGQAGECQFPCDWRNGVFVWDNDLRVSALYKLRYFARRLALCDRTVDVNMQQQHHPLILTVPQELQSDAEGIYRQYANGEPAILGTKVLREIVNNITCIKTDAPFIAEGVQTVQRNIWGQGLPVHGFRPAAGEDRAPRGRRDTGRDGPQRGHAPQLLGRASPGLRQAVPNLGQARNGGLGARLAERQLRVGP